MTVDKVIADLKKGKVAPCYLLYGEEDYLIQDALRRIVDLLVSPADRDFSLFSVDGETADFDLIRDHLLSPSLLGGSKVVVVKQTTVLQSREKISEVISKIRSVLQDAPDKAVSWFAVFLQHAGFEWEDVQNDGWRKISDEQWRRAVEGDGGEDRHLWLPRVIEICAVRGGISAAKSAADPAERLARLLEEGFGPGNCLILTADSADRRKKLFKLIEKTGVVLHFGEVKGEALTRETFRQTAQGLLDESGKKLSSDAWMALGRKTGFQLRPSVNELQKLIAYVGNRSVIEASDVEAVVGRTKEDSIFDLTTALSEKNAPTALAALNALLDQGAHHLMILTMISREIRMLTQALILRQSGTLPKFNAAMDFPSFQKHVYPAVAALSLEATKKDDLLINKHPYVIYNAMKSCGRFSYPVLLRYLDELLRMDRVMKSSATDPRLLLERFLVNACA